MPVKARYASCEIATNTFWKTTPTRRKNAYRQKICAMTFRKIISPSQSASVRIYGCGNLPAVSEDDLTLLARTCWSPKPLHPKSKYYFFLVYPCPTATREAHAFCRRMTSSFVLSAVCRFSGFLRNDPSESSLSIMSLECLQFSAHRFSATSFGQRLRNGHLEIAGTRK